MSFAELVNARYSVRQYTDQPVSEDIIRRVLDAARLAPSACNNQPWHFYVIRDPATRRRLFPTERQSWIAQAPVLIVACSIPADAWVRSHDGKNHADVDLGIAMEHLMLAATEEGLGTCWLCAFDPERFRSVLALPAGMEPVAATPLGYPATVQGPRERKELDEIVTWR